MVDAEYSNQLDRIIIASSYPLDAVHVYDVALDSDKAVNLVIGPRAISVSLDGTKAVVAADYALAYVDLVHASIIATYNLSSDVSDVVAGDDIAYVIPRSMGALPVIHMVDLSTGVETTTTDATGGGPITPGTRGMLSPFGDALLLADPLSDEVRRYVLVNRVPQFSARLAGGCGDVWPSTALKDIFTRCGNVDTLDLSSQNHLMTVTKLRSVGDSPIAHQIAVFTDVDDTQVHVFDTQTLQENGAGSVPGFPIAGGMVQGHGRFVFFDKSGSRIWIILQADPSYQQMADFGVAVL